MARLVTHRLSQVRRVTFDNTRLLWNYAVAQGLFAVLLVHFFPRGVG
jgi:cytochrome c oxidase subunit I+III